MHGIKDHNVYELCSDFRRLVRRFPMSLWYGHPAIRPLLADQRIFFDSHLVAYSIGPNCTILFVYIVFESLPLGVLFGCVFLSQGKDIVG